MRSLAELKKMIDDAKPVDGEFVHVVHEKIAAANLTIAREMLERIRRLDELMVEVRGSIAVHRSDRYK